ncbi:hypothetical protein V8C37DRAFT_374791 [Trichoderma ceciliae]
MSSPLQDPQSLPQEHTQEKIVRPALSSIMRAGRVLQSVTSDPPSPGDREKQLGSPFRSSTSKESSHSAKEDRHLLLSKSPPQSLNFGNDQLAISMVPVNYGMTADTEAFSMNMDGADQRLDRRATEPVHKKRPPSRESVASSLGNTPPSDGALSWVEKEGPESPNLNGDDTLLQAARSSRSNKEPIPLGQVDGAGEEPDTAEEEEGGEGEGEGEEEEQEDDEDDIDIWEFEAQREAPPRQALQQRLIPSVQDRSTAPGPSRSWRDAQQATETTAAAAGFSNDQSKTYQMKHTIGQQSNENAEDEEHSLISRNQLDKEPETASRSKRFDLSSFFSSPAAIPGLLAEKFMSIKSKAPVKPATRQAEPVIPAQEPPGMPTTSMFPRLPQDGNGLRNLRRSEPISSPIRYDPPGDEQEIERSSSPATPERPHLPIIAQKQNFTPRPRQTSNAFFQPSSSHASTTPPRMQLSHDDIQRWQLETSNASEDSPSLRSLLRPLPSKHASPKKSSLRSPLKPHTPGRVVEFTSSVLSPQEQARIREQRNRASEDVSEQDISTVAATSTHVEPRAGKGSMGRRQQQQQQQPPKLIPSRIIKPAGVTKNRPVKKRRRRELPSETIWTRQHWIFLDTLLQMRRQSPFSEEYEPVSQKYLGRIITSMGESMVLEKWHLECVDAFKSQIGGWDEGELAKRLFALILGEAKRRRSSVDQSPGAMFH